MKYILSLSMALLFWNTSLAQNDNDELRVNTTIRFQTFFPIQFGNTALAKAHKPKPGFSAQMNMLDFKNFKFGWGFDLSTYDITDKEMIANLSTSKYTSIYMLLSYEYKVNNKFQITPNIGYGSASLALGSRASRFGKQTGNEFRIGSNIDYRISNAIFVIGGLNYVHNVFDIHTSPEYESFFSKANQIQINFGIRFGN
jgi:hypothetical protein